MTPRLLLRGGLAGAVLAAVFGAVLDVTPAAGAEYPWCANFHEGAGTNCGFTSYEQCMLTVRGSGGFCAKNDFYTGPAGTPQARRPVRNRPATKKD
jgi:hypothetical protein